MMRVAATLALRHAQKRPLLPPPAALTEAQHHSGHMQPALGLLSQGQSGPAGPTPGPWPRVALSSTQQGATLHALVASREVAAKATGAWKCAPGTRGLQTSAESPAIQDLPNSTSTELNVLHGAQRPSQAPCDVEGQAKVLSGLEFFELALKKTHSIQDLSQPRTPLPEDPIYAERADEYNRLREAHPDLMHNEILRKMTTWVRSEQGTRSYEEEQALLKSLLQDPHAKRRPSSTPLTAQDMQDMTAPFHAKDLWEACGHDDFRGFYLIDCACEYNKLRRDSPELSPSEALSRLRSYNDWYDASVVEFRPTWMDNENICSINRLIKEMKETLKVVRRLKRNGYRVVMGSELGGWGVEPPSEWLISGPRDVPKREALSGKHAEACVCSGCHPDREGKRFLVEVPVQDLGKFFDRTFAAKYYNESNKAQLTELSAIDVASMVTEREWKEMDDKERNYYGVLAQFINGKRRQHPNYHNLLQELDVSYPAYKNWPQRTVYAMARGSAIWTGDEVTWDLVISRLEELYNCFLRLKKEGYEWQGTFNDGCYFLKRRLVP